MFINTITRKVRDTYRQWFIGICSMFLLMFVALNAQAVQNAGYAQDSVLVQMVASQDQAEDEMLISIHIEDMQLAEALDLLAEKLRVGISFSTEIMPDKKVNLELSNAPVFDVLYKLLEDTNLEPTLPSSKDVIVIREKESVEDVKLFQETVRGTVSDAETGEVLPGVNIVIHGTTTGTTTDMSGEFSLNINEVGVDLEFRFVGYVSETIEVTQQHINDGLDVRLLSDVALMDEMIVVGFGTQRRADVTGAVSAVSGAEIERRPVTNTALALQGMSPGLTILNQGGGPGEADVVARIRGVGTLNDSSPLVLVDGVEQSLSTVEPENIESISVLKDAASASIYGSRAANGVILIETKRGAESGVIVSYDNHVGWINTLGFPEPADPESWLRLENEAQVNAGNTPQFSEEYIQNVAAGTNPYEFPFADWESAIFNDNAFEHHHALSVSTGGETGRMFTSINYTDSDGVLNNFNHQQFSVRLNADLFATDNLTFQSNLLYRNRDFSGPGWPGGQGGLVHDLLHVNRDFVMRFPDDTFEARGGGRNAWVIANHGETSRVSDDVVGKIGLNYQINESISFSGDVTLNNITLDEFQFRPEFNGMRHYITGEPIVVTGWFAVNTLDERRWSQREQSHRAHINFVENFDRHGVELMTGYEEIVNRTRQLTASRDNFFTNDLRSLNAGDTSNQTTGGFDNTWRIRSFFGRLNYSFDDRYQFQANIRYDGSSRFGAGNRWGLFPSFSAGWRISSEQFMPDIDMISNLRLRASWGQLGNERIGLFRFLNEYSLNQGYQFPGQPVTGSAVTQAGNPNITWETTTITNLGLDIGLMEDRLEIVGEYFWKITDDILLDIPIAPSIGVSGPTQNAAKVSNIGYEISVNFRGISSSDQGFQYSLGVNFSDVVNRIEDLRGSGPLFPDKFTVWTEGESINSLRGLMSPGLYRTQEDLERYPAVINPNAGIGDIIYKDLNGDGEISQTLYPEGDQYIMGNEDPRYEFGINFSASYRGFDFAMFWQGVLRQYHSLDGALMEGPNHNNFIPAVMARETFHPERNPEGTWPLVRAGNTWNLVEADFWLQDTKYLRLKNFQFGYTIPQNLLSSLRVFISGENLLTFTPTELYDPETPRGRNQIFPHNKIISAGVNVRF
jgi:TonB-linked SusC/RagA family outer membrane protein